MNANERTGLVHGYQHPKPYSWSAVRFVAAILLFTFGAFLLFIRGGFSLPLQQSLTYEGFPWEQYASGDVNSHNYGQNFQHLSERFFLDVLGEDELPRPRFVGSGSGQGTFQCSDFKEQWDQLNCFQMTMFMNNLLDLQHKRLASYLLALVDKPSEIQKIMDTTKSLGGKQAQDMNGFLKGYGGAPYDLVQDFGGGSGAGMQIMCNGTLLFTMGGGGGGGVELAVNKTWDWQGGGGGGVQIYDPDNNNTFASLGGGQGTPNYTANVDQDANVTAFKKLWPKVKSTIRNCPRDVIHLHGGGGGGGGISVRNVETYLWKYFYFYFEYGSDPNTNSGDQNQGENGEGGQGGQDQYQQNKFCQNQTMSENENDYCLHIPNEDRRKHCEEARKQSEQAKAQQKDTHAALTKPTTKSPSMTVQNVAPTDSKKAPANRS